MPVAKHETSKYDVQIILNVVVNQHILHRFRRISAPQILMRKTNNAEKTLKMTKIADTFNVKIVSFYL